MTTCWPVRMASGQRMRVYGTTEFILQMSEWKGKVAAVVLDIQADFDIVLGMSWIDEWDPMPNWRKREFKVETSEGTKRIRSISTGTPDLEPLEEIAKEEFNFMSEKEVKKAFKKKGQSECMLYFAREVHDDEQDGDEPLLQINSLQERAGDSSNAELQALLQEFKDVFRDELPDGLPPNRAVDHEINTGTEPPSNQNAYPLSVVQLEEQTKQIDNLFKRGLIRESTSPWGAPVLFVRKLKVPGEWRMCIDYRALNHKTLKNAYPLPRIQDCLDRLGKASHLTTLDLTSGYWQVRIAEGDIPKTAFNTRYGKYEFLVMPFGLTNAPAMFQTMMNAILRPYIDKFVLVYLDDVLVYSNSEEEHLEHLRLVFEALRQNRIYARPKKCVFNQKHVEFCGHIVGQGVTKVLDSKVRAINDWPQPKNVQEVRQFYGLVNYYHRFIRHFSIIAAPLSDLFKSQDNDKQKRRPIIWSTVHQVAFERLKNAITIAPVLISQILRSR